MFALERSSVLVCNYHGEEHVYFHKCGDDRMFDMGYDVTHAKVTQMNWKHMFEDYDQVCADFKEIVVDTSRSGAGSRHCSSGTSAVAAVAVAIATDSAIRTAVVVW